MNTICRIGMIHDDLRSHDTRGSQLEKKEVDLQRREAFCKEQLELIEQKHMDYYRLASAQFNEEATIADTHVK
ncbi:hypothetical protein scyTo_0003870 [Scyliorhinus torazame]|uniref:Uncharacterized protein n=1 Tax=Scyliorhinus torazame TaxID=75743 RepID=A0A401PNU4_SCYTO|nr:hypothetical protein [Scyliorhinus torazame]